jgi:hypothetical protein
MALMHILFSFKIYMLCNPIKGVLPEPNSEQATEKQLPKLFFKLIFSLSAKLHLETVWLLIPHAIPCGIFCSSGNSSRIGLYLWEVWSPGAFL